MKNIVLFLVCVLLLCSCASNKPASKISQQDLNMFKKTFEGTLINKKSEPYSRTENIMGLPFWTKTITANYLQLTVIDKNGKIRKFYDYSEKEKRKNELKQYDDELNSGDLIIIDMGFIDEGLPEELFDSVKKK